MWLLEEPFWDLFLSSRWQDEGSRRESAAEAVQGAALPLERVHDVHGGDGLALGVLRVRHSIADDILEEHLEDAAGLFVDESRDALDAASARETTDRWLGDALDVVSQNLAVTLRSTFSKSLPLSDGWGIGTNVPHPGAAKLNQPSSFNSDNATQGRVPPGARGNLLI